MDPVNKAIWQKFHVKRDDVLPFKGFAGDRNTLAELFCELGYRCGAEIGVEHGRFAATLCEKNPDLLLKCIDPWAAFSHHSDDEMEAIRLNAVARLARYKVEFIRKTSLEAAKETPDLSLDFVHIDGLHDFDSVMQDIIAWTPKVKRGGIVSGHDYYRFYGYGVIPAVDAYTRAHNVSMYYMTHEDQSPSWFWVR